MEQHRAHVDASRDLAHAGVEHRVARDPERAVLLALPLQREADDVPRNRAAQRWAVAARRAEALSQRGEGVSITAAHGAVLIPDEAHEASAALALADARMYHDKNAGRRPAAGVQSGSAPIST
jgi:hypothetical protein